LKGLRRGLPWTVAVAVGTLTAAASLSVNLLSQPVAALLPSYVNHLAVPLFLLAVIIIVTAEVWRRVRDVAFRRLPILGREMHVQRHMIRDVGSKARQALNETFTGIPLLNLTLTFRQDLVSASRLLPDVPASLNGSAPIDSREIRTVFERAGRSLLIVGDGGSGKSTLLADLCERLAADECLAEMQPMIPVLVNLGTWQPADTSLHEWLCRTAADTYGVRSQLLSAWSDRRLLIPILDGLDQVPDGMRDAVAGAINHYRRSGPCAVAISCRTEEYCKLKTPIDVSFAVELARPARPQVKAYLSSLGSPAAAAVSQVSENDAAWWELIGTPLMLGMIARISNTHPAAKLVVKGSIQQRKRFILDRYVGSLLERRADRESGFSAPDARRWLEWLAEWIARHGGPELLIDRLQPEWIADVAASSTIKSQPRFWLPITWTVALAIALATDAVLHAQFGGVIPLLVFGLEVTTVTSWRMRSRHASPTRPIEPTSEMTGPWLALGLIAILSGGLGVVSAYLREGDFPVTPSSAQLQLLLHVVTVFLVGVPLLVAAGVAETVPDDKGMAPGVRLRRSRRNAWIAALFIGVPTALAAGIARGLAYSDLAIGLSFGIPFAVICAAACWLLCGGVPWLQYRALARSLERAEYGPRDYLRFLEWSREHLLLLTAGSAYRFPHPEIQRHLAASWRRRRSASGPAPDR
jgi:hypothetical protein